MSRASKKDQGFSAEERAAMKERAKELKAEKNRAEGEADLLSKIAEMPEHDRAMATRLHELISAAAPDLWPKTWYGMPAYALDGKILCFFQSGAKFQTRYSTFGFNEAAKLDDGPMWPASFALLDLTPEGEEKIIALVKKALGAA